jgi:hypothetical protein
VPGRSIANRKGAPSLDFPRLPGIPKIVSIVTEVVPYKVSHGSELGKLALVIVLGASCGVGSTIFRLIDSFLFCSQPTQNFLGLEILVIVKPYENFADNFLLAIPTIVRDASPRPSFPLKSSTIEQKLPISILNARRILYPSKNKYMCSKRLLVDNDS